MQECVGQAREFWCSRTEALWAKGTSEDVTGPLGFPFGSKDLQPGCSIFSTYEMKTFSNGVVMISSFWNLDSKCSNSTPCCLSETAPCCCFFLFCLNRIHLPFSKAQDLIFSSVLSKWVGGTCPLLMFFICLSLCSGDLFHQYLL